MKPKKVFLTFGFVFILFVVACCISLASANENRRTSEPEQTRTSTVRYELPKVLPSAWLTAK